MKKLAEVSKRPLQRLSEDVLAGPFAVFEEKNQNRRFYPGNVYEEALNQLMPKIESGALLGECDHPLDYDEVRLSNVSHVITECSVRQDTDGKRRVYGKVRLLDTPSGRIVKALVKAGIPVGISSRAVGDADMRDGVEYVTAMNLITYDLVADPSFKGAVLSPEAIDEAKRELSAISKSLPLTESVSRNHTRQVIQSLKESLSSDFRVKGSDKSRTNPTRNALLEANKLLAKKSKLLDEATASTRRLERRLKLAESRSEAVNRQLTESRVALESCNGRMERLQEAYNELKETTVPKSDYDRASTEIQELRKQLIVESRGLVYSQVRKILEGAKTEREVNEILDGLRYRNFDEAPESYRDPEAPKMLESRVMQGLADVFARV